MDPVTVKVVLGAGLVIELMVMTGRLASGLVDVPADQLAVEDVLEYHRFEAFSCQISGDTQAISMTLAVVVSTTPFKTTFPSDVNDQRFPEASLRLAVVVVIYDPDGEAPPVTAVTEYETEPALEPSETEVE